MIPMYNTSMGNINKDCDFCGEAFPNFSGRAKFCSPTCRTRAFAKGRPTPEQATRHCQHCNKTYWSSDKRRKFCSTKCNVAAQNAKRKTTKEIPKQCPICGKDFKPMQKRGVGRTYCSKACHRVVRRQANKVWRNERSYEYRKRVKWDGNWWEALQRDKFTCQLCSKQSYPSQWTGEKTRLVVHHRDGSGERGNKNHALDNLMTLCAPCHRKFHTLHLVWDGSDYKVAGEIFAELGISELSTTALP